MPMLTMRLSDEEQARLRTMADAAGLTVAGLIRRTLLEPPVVSVDVEQMARELGLAHARLATPSEAESVLRAQIDQMGAELFAATEEIARLKRELAKANAEGATRGEAPAFTGASAVRVAATGGLSREAQHATQDAIRSEDRGARSVLARAFPQRKGRGE